MIRTDVELGDFRNSPRRVGGYSRTLVKPGVYEVGLCVMMPLARFPLGAVVALELDGRRFVGNVVFATPERVTLSGGEHDCVTVVVEGRFE